MTITFSASFLLVLGVVAVAGLIIYFREKKNKQNLIAIQEKVKETHLDNLAKTELCGELKKKNEALENLLCEIRHQTDESKEQNESLTALVEQVNDRAAQAEAEQAKTKEEMQKLQETFADFRKQLRDNTDLELATTQQIIEQLQTRKSLKALMIMPKLGNGPDGEVTAVGVDTIACGLSKHQVLFLIQATLQGLGFTPGPEGFNNPFGDDDGEEWKRGNKDDE